jgi:ZIP family zinc transporter
MSHGVLADSFIAGLLASLACGLGALPLFLPGVDVQRRAGIAYGFAGGLMFAASVYNLILPGLVLGDHHQVLPGVAQIVGGILLGALFITGIDRLLTNGQLKSLRRYGSRTELLIFIAMCFHSMPEGIAVGVGYASSEHVPEAESLGTYIAFAIGIHNIPEGLAVSVPMRANGASFFRCFTAAVLTSLPQPFTAVPAAYLVGLFEPLIVPLLGFAAGAMLFLIVKELMPDAFLRHSPRGIAWSFIVGFSAMLCFQVII